MKKLLLTIFQIVIINTAFSQDLLIKKNGEEIKVKVMEINQSEIKYKKALNLTGPIYTISKSDIFMIRYEDGTKDVFNEEKTKNNNDNNINNLDMASKGKEDANTFYKGNNSGAGNHGPQRCNKGACFSPS